MTLASAATRPPTEGGPLLPERPGHFVGIRTLETITVDLDTRPTPATRLYLLLPEPFGTPLLQVLAGPTPALDAAAAQMNAAFDVLNGRSGQAGADVARFADRYLKSLEQLKADYDRRTGPAGTYGPFQLKPDEPWAKIVSAGIRACLLASSLLLHRTDWYVAPATLMALLVIEGKIERNRFYHGFDFLPNGFSALKELNHLLDIVLKKGEFILESRRGQKRYYKIPESEKRGFSDAERRTGSTTFEAVTADEPRYRWWAWSHAMPHFWSMDWAVRRYPDNPSGLQMPPSAHGANISRKFVEWLSGLQAIHALQDEAEVASIVAYCGNAGGAFVVQPTAAANSDDAAWPIRIRASNASQTLALFLYLMGSFYLLLKWQISQGFNVDVRDVPDWPTYAAYNSAKLAGRVSGRFAPAKSDEQVQRLISSWLTPQLTAQERRAFRSNYPDDEPWANAYRFLYIRDALAPLMDIAWRGK